MDLKIDLMMTSCQKRAIQSLKNVREKYTHAAETPCEIFSEIHEHWGVHQHGHTLPGLKRSEVLELIPELTIPED